MTAGAWGREALRVAVMEAATAAARAEASEAAAEQGVAAVSEAD